MLLNIVYFCVSCAPEQQASWPLSIRQSSCTPSDEQDIVNQITDFILLLCSSFLIWEFGAGNEIGGHSSSDDLIVAARHALWKSILNERYVSKVFSRWNDHLTFPGVNQKVRSHTTAIGYYCYVTQYASL